MAVRPDIGAIQSGSAGIALIERLRAGTENRRVMQWPGSDSPDARFVMEPVLCDALQDSYAATWERFRELKIEMNVYNSDEFFAELAVQVLARAIRDPDDPSKPLFGTADSLRASLKPSERDALSSMYQSFVAEVDPSPDQMPDELFSQIEDYVKKKDVVRLSAISSPMLATYIIGTASQSAN